MSILERVVLVRTDVHYRCMCAHVCVQVVCVLQCFIHHTLNNKVSQQVYIHVLYTEDR